MGFSATADAMRSAVALGLAVARAPAVASGGRGFKSRRPDAVSATRPRRHPPGRSASGDYSSMPEAGDRSQAAAANGSRGARDDGVAPASGGQEVYPCRYQSMTSMSPFEAP